MRRARCLGLIALLACDGSQPGAMQPPRAVRIPSLRCAEVVVPEGDCRRDGDCGEGQLCRAEELVAVPDRGPFTLRCGAASGVRAARERCEQAADCGSGLCALGGVCLAPCAADEDCETGLSCQRVEARVDSGLAPIMACARATAFADDVTVSVAAPRTLLPNQLNRTAIDLPAGDSLVLLKVDCGLTLRVQRVLEQASGATLFDVASQLNGIVQRNPVLNSGSLVPLLFPNQPTRTMNAGRYDLGLVVEAASTLQVVTATRGKAHERLALNVFYVGGGQSLTPGGFHPGSAELGEVLGALSARFEALGLQVEAIREYDVTGALRSELSTLSVREVRDEAGRFLRQEVQRVGELFGLSAGLDDGGLNVFVVRDMGDVRGISGGVPGALGVHGTAASGVAIALDRVGLVDADRALFHELGHQIGLFHTTEIDGTVYEPLSDTPSCNPSADSSGDGKLTFDECSAEDGDNLMFWEGQGDQLSPQQIALLQRSLVLR